MRNSCMRLMAKCSNECLDCRKVYTSPVSWNAGFHQASCLVRVGKSEQATGLRGFGEAALLRELHEAGVWKLELLRQCDRHGVVAVCPHQLQDKTLILQPPYTHGPRQGEKTWVYIAMQNTSTFDLEIWRPCNLLQPPVYQTLV